MSDEWVTVADAVERFGVTPAYVYLAIKRKIVPFTIGHDVVTKGRRQTNLMLVNVAGWNPKPRKRKAEVTVDGN